MLDFLFYIRRRFDCFTQGFFVAGLFACAIIRADISTGASVFHDTIKGFSSCGPNKMVALTFDDGPSVDRNTTAVLDILFHEGVIASFFVSPFAYGWHSKGQIELLRRMHKEGHSIQSHGYMHKPATQLSDDQLIDELSMTDVFLADADIPPAKMFRPPYGKLSHRQVYLLSSKRPGTVIAMWNVESGDHLHGTNGLAHRVESSFNQKVGYGNSAVVLLHDPIYSAQSLELVKIIHFFKSMHYKFVSVDECYAACMHSICAGPGENNAYRDVLVLSTFL